MRRRGWPGARMLAGILLAALLPVCGCTRRPAAGPDAVKPPGPRPASSPAPAPSAQVVPEMRAVMEALDGGRLGQAAALLEERIGAEVEIPLRSRALFTLALLLARPDYAGRDISRARSLLEELLRIDPQAGRERGAGLILALLDLEAEQLREIRTLRLRLAISRAEADDLRGALAQRETELRRIKEILLGRAGGS